MYQKVSGGTDGASKELEELMAQVEENKLRIRIIENELKAVGSALADGTRLHSLLSKD